MKQGTNWGRISAIACWIFLLASYGFADQKGVKRDPCQPGAGFLGLEKGFVYDGIEVKFIKDVEPKTDAEKKKEKDSLWLKTTNVELAVTGSGKTTSVELTQQQWLDAQNGCAAGKVPPDIKQKLGLPAQNVPRGPAVMAAIDFDIGDLNQDGPNDHVKVVPPAPSLLVELNNGSSPLDPIVTYAAGPNPTAVVLADFNADRKVDAAIANSGDFGQNNGSLSVLIGNGDGTFRAPVFYAAGGSAISLAVADFNADQRPDIAVVKQNAPGGGGTLAVLIGVGDGTFSAAGTYPTESGPVSVLSVDLTGDQKLDLAVANKDAVSISVLTGNGDGSFRSPVVTPVGSQPSYLGASDLNRDGRYDLVILHRASAILSVWFGQTNGSLQYSARYLTGVGTGSFVILDDDENDRPILLAPDSVAPRMLVYGVAPDGTLTGAPAYLVGRTGESLAVADFNADTRPDLVVGRPSGPAVLLGRPNAALQDPLPVAIDSSLSGGSFSPVTTGDFNGDGKADLAMGHNLASRVSIQTGRGDGTFQPAGTLSGVTAPRFISVLDINADGRLDLGVVSEGQQNQGSVSVFLGNGDATFQSAATYPAGPLSLWLASGDLNADGHPDLVVVNQGGAARASLSVLLANANGTLQPAVNLDAGVSASSAVIDDFNRDGKTDIAFSGLLENSPNFIFAVAVLPGNGNGTFQERIVTRTGLSQGPLALADFNADGNPDLGLVTCCGSTDLTQMLGNGDGTFRVENFVAGKDPTAIVAADFDKDGVPDLAVLDAAEAERNSVVTILTGSEAFAVNVSAARNRAGLIAPDSIVAAYGGGLATGTAQAPGADWPESLAGTTVRVRDIEGAERNARIYFAGPNQVNYLMPAGTATGYARVTITSASGAVTESIARITPVAPSLFSVNSDNLAAAYVVRALPDGTSRTDPVAQTGAQGQIIAAPVDLGPDDQPVILVLFGTGIRGRASLSDVQVLIGGEQATVLYADTQNQYPGLDQVNAVIPKSLRGRNRVDVRLFVGDIEANRVSIRIR